MNRQQQGDAPGNQQSDSVSNLFEALALAHSKIENVAQNRTVEVPIKDKNNPGQTKGKYKFVYATYANILHHIRPALTENGLWFTQFVRGGEMVTRIYHKSGEFIDSGNIPIPNISGSPQDIGSLMSYFRRYSLSEAFGLASEEDNDGEQGDRQVEFKARGTRRDIADEERPSVEEPAGGWGDWARTLIADVALQTTDDELNTLRDANKRFINGAEKYDKFMYGAIQKAFKDKRAIVNDNVPF